MISIVLVEDNDRDRERIVALLKSQQDLFLQGQGYDGYDALKLTRVYRPDIILLSLYLNFYNGMEISSLLKRDSPESSVMLMSSRIESSMIKKSIGGNVAAYLIKEEDLENLAAIIRKVKAGEMYINSRIGVWALHMLEDLLPGIVRRESGKAAFHSDRSKKKAADEKSHAELSVTEMQILIFISCGNTDKEIAGRLRLKDGTVRNYVSKLKKKACIKTRAELVRYAIKRGFTSWDN